MNKWRIELRYCVTIGPVIHSQTTFKWFSLLVHIVNFCKLKQKDKKTKDKAVLYKI